MKPVACILEWKGDTRLVWVGYPADRPYRVIRRQPGRRPLLHVGPTGSWPLSLRESVHWYWRTDVEGQRYGGDWVRGEGFSAWLAAIYERLPR